MFFVCTFILTHVKKNVSNGTKTTINDFGRKGINTKNGFVVFNETLWEEQLRQMKEKQIVATLATLFIHPSHFVILA
jgi:hypothetical protein